VGAEGAVKFILGVGNPGRKYERTRHNVGFRVVDRLAQQAGETIGREKYQALMAQTVIEGQTVVLVKPQTFVNLTGRSAAALLRFYKAPAESLLVVVDDTHLPVGKLRVRPDGSAGGHNGLRSLIQDLGTDTFGRLRVGVGGKQHPAQDLADHVLGRFTEQEEQDIEVAVETATDVCRLWIEKDIAACMNRFNGSDDAA
jgi:PTH1 family peptidyl-tRNA hydrolase